MKLLDYLKKNKIYYSESEKGLSVGGSLDLRGTSITELPDGLSVGGSLYLRGTSITELPDGLSVGGGLDLRGTSITELPDGLSVGGSLYLRGTSITELPDGLSVGDSLDLEGSSITELPDGLSVGGGLYLRKGIKNATHKENCGRQGRTIFAVMNKGAIKVAAGCSFGTLQEFFDAVDNSYSGAAAEKYKNDAQDCADRLIEMLSK